MKKIRVMTFNMKNDSFFTAKIRSFQSRKSIILSIINKYQLDVIGVQELALPMKYELSTALPQYEFLGSCRSKTHNKFNEHTDILVLKNKFEIINQETFWLTKSPNIQGSKMFLALFPRICTYVTIKDTKTQQQYRIFNSHLDPLLEITRKKQLNVLIDYLTKIHDITPLPTIVMGDFNCKPHSNSLRFLDNHTLGFKSIYLSQMNTNTFHFFRGKAIPNRSPIDYIYISKEISLAKFKIITDNHNGLYPSDHFPVMADLYIRS